MGRRSMTPDLDELIARADPAREAVIPGADSPSAQALLERILSEDGFPHPLDLSAISSRARRAVGTVRWRPPAWTLGAVTAVVAVLVVVGVVPSPLHSTSPAGASELTKIAHRAGVQPAVTLGPGDYLHTRMNASFAVSLTTGVPVTATVLASLESWVNTAGTVYYRNNFGSARFASPADMRAWQDAGLSVTPVLPQPDLGRAVVQAAHGFAGASQAFGYTVLDVGSLPTDPGKLGPLLEAGRTGIGPLDAISPALAGGVDRAEFDRVALLLLGPEVGGSPALASALYTVLAAMPGIRQLGVVEDHSGRSGEGFALGPVTLVVDPATGEVRELRSADPALFQSNNLWVTRQFNVPGGSGMPVPHGSGAALTDAVAWVDPAGSPSAVPLASVPSRVRRAG